VKGKEGSGGCGHGSERGFVHAACVWDPLCGENVNETKWKLQMIIKTAEQIVLSKTCVEMLIECSYATSFFNS
jgi:hypothetical protein